MDDGTKQQNEDLARYAGERAQELLDKAVRFGSEHGPQACLGELIEAGALLSAATELRKRAE